MFVGTGGDDMLVGTDSADTLEGLAGDDDLSGLDGGDSLIGGDGTDTLNGGGGDDTLLGGAGASTTVDGGDGVDVVVIEDAGIQAAFGDLSNPVADFGFQLRSNSTASLSLARLSGVEVIEFRPSTGAAFQQQLGLGGSGADALAATLGLRLLAYAGAGDDTVTGSGVGDELRGGDGADSLLGGDGSDALLGESGDDTLRGGGGADRLIGGGGANVFDGGAGPDKFRLSTFTGAIDRIEGFSFEDAISFGFTNFSSANLSVVSAPGETLLQLDFNLDAVIDATVSIGPEFAGSSFIVVRTQIAFDAGEILLADPQLINGTPAGDGIADSGGDDTINGLAGDDRLSASYGDDNVFGGDGNDSLSVFGIDDALIGNSLLDGGAGDDSIDADVGDDTIVGGEGADALSGGYGANVINAGGGDDFVGVTFDLSLPGFSAGDVEVIDGGEGADRLSNGPSGAFEDLSGRSFALTAAGGVLTGTISDNGGVLRSFTATNFEAFGANLLSGSNGVGLSVTVAGDLSFLTGADTVNGLSAFRLGLFDIGAGGADFISFAGVTAIPPGIAVGSSTLSSILQAFGSGGDDTIVGSAFADRLIGGAGMDSLNGGGGADTLLGGDGGDRIDGAAGADHQFGGLDADTLLGGDDDDILSGGAGADSLNGGGGVDAVSYLFSDEFELASGPVTVVLSNPALNLGDAAGDIINFSVEQVLGTVHGDFLQGNSSANLLSGNDGADTLLGAFGDDTLAGGGGADSLNGGDGFDVASYQFGTAFRIALWNPALNTGDAAGDIVHFTVEAILGSTAGDTIEGNSSNNDLRGAGGDDILRGGFGDDVLDGGAGADDLFGSGGFDVATYRSAAAGVTIVLSNLGANAGEAAGDTIRADVERVEGSAFDDLLQGNASGNQLSGGAGNDTLIGAFGDDTLSGGTDADVFVISAGSGFDAVADFGDGADVIRLLGFGAAFDSFAEVLAASTETGGNVAITLGAQVITLNGVSLASLTPSDFLFS